MGFLFYACWNIFYLTCYKIPPSIFYKLTGIPSPTTGMYRSFIGFINMDKDAYFNNNPFVIPLIILLLITFTVLTKKYKDKQPLLISSRLGISYLLIFIISEIWMLLNL